MAKECGSPLPPVLNTLSHSNLTIWVFHLKVEPISFFLYYFISLFLSPFFTILWKKMWNEVMPRRMFKKYWKQRLNRYLYTSVIHSSQKVERIQMSISKWINKIYRYNGILFSYKKRIIFWQHGWPLKTSC